MSSSNSDEAYSVARAARKHLKIAQRALKKQLHKQSVGITIHKFFRSLGVEEIAAAMHEQAADYDVIVQYVEGHQVWVTRAS